MIPPVVRVCVQQFHIVGSVKNLMTHWWSTDLRCFGAFSRQARLNCTLLCTNEDPEVLVAAFFEVYTCSGLSSVVIRGEKGTSYVSNELFRHFNRFSCMYLVNSPE